MTQLTHWKKLENPDYIGAYAFQPGEKKVVTIASVSREMITGTEGKKSEETVVRFRENEKPMILNVTNAKQISKHAGSPFIEQWQGVRIILGVEKVKAFGDVVEAVRVQKEKAPQPEQAIPPCADCGGEIKPEGGASVKSIVAAGLKRYGVALCMECALKRAEKMKEEKDRENNENQDQ